MITRRRMLFLSAVAILAGAAPALAHHSWPVDFSREITVKGTVTDYNWGNPHVMIGLDVKRDDGTTEKWNVGGPSTNRMEANGWIKSRWVEIENGRKRKYYSIRRDGQKVLHEKREQWSLIHSVLNGLWKEKYV